MDEIPTPMHVAAQRGDKPTLRTHLQLSPQSPEVKDHLGRTPVIHAVMSDRSDCLALLLKAGARVDNADNSGQTALHWAAYKGHSNCVRLLLAAGAAWHQTDVDGVTPLHLAAKGRSQKCLQSILNEVSFGKVDIWDCQKKTSLHWSASSVNVEHIKLLLKKGANVNIHDEEGRTPVHCTASCNSPKAAECIRVLLEAASTIVDWQDYAGRTALHLAVVSGSVEVVDLLSLNQKCLDLPDSLFRTPLHLAAMLGLSDKVAILLDRGANPSSRDANKATPLHYAAWGDHAETLSVFLSRSYVKDEEDSSGRSALLWAATAGADSSLATLASHGLQLHRTDRRSNSALHYAVYHNHPSTVQSLLRLGLDVDHGNEDLVTPLLLSCQMGRSKLVRLLLDSGASLQTVDSHRRSALHCAADGGQAYTAQILLQLVADPNVRDYYGLTPLHYAAYHGHANCLAVLLHHSADPNVCDNQGETALHWACFGGRSEAVRLLVRASAHLNVLSALPNRCTPLDYATLKNHQGVEEVLVEAGGLSARTIRHLAAISIQRFYRRHFVKESFKVERKPISHIPEEFSNKIPVPVRCKQKSEASCSLCGRSDTDVRSSAATVLQRAWKRHRQEKSLRAMHQRALEIFCGEEGLRAASREWLDVLSQLQVVDGRHPISTLNDDART